MVYNWQIPSHASRQIRNSYSTASTGRGTVIPYTSPQALAALVQFRAVHFITYCPDCMGDALCNRQLNIMDWMMSVKLKQDSQALLNSSAYRHIGCRAVATNSGLHYPPQLINITAQACTPRRPCPLAMSQTDNCSCSPHWHDLTDADPWSLVKWIVTKRIADYVRNYVYAT